MTRNFTSTRLPTYHPSMAPTKSVHELVTDQKMTSSEERVDLGHGFFRENQKLVVV
jgi:hypothetical protein